MAKSSTAHQTFSSILDTPSSEIERPKPMPVGQYVCVVQGQPRFDKSRLKQTDFVEFTMKFLETVDSTVDDDALAVVGGIKDKTVKATYYLTDTALWRLKDFLDHCDAGDEDMSLRQRIAETPGKRVTITIGHESSQDGQTVFARVKDTAAVE